MAWNVHDYPEPPEDKPVRGCDGCHDEMTDTVFFVDGRVICAECFREYMSQFDLVELADAFGFEHTTLDALEWSVAS